MTLDRTLALTTTGREVQIHTRRFIVRGNGAFPVDMLRYDRCWPVGEADSHTIERTTRREHGPHDVQLVGLSDPTEARWRSFGWEVQPDA